MSQLSNMYMQCINVCDTVLLIITRIEDFFLFSQVYMWFGYSSHTLTFSLLCLGGVGGGRLEHIMLFFLAYYSIPQFFIF